MDKRSWFITCEFDESSADAARNDGSGSHDAAEAIVLGISGKPEEMVHTDRVAEAGVPLIKRFSGGGTIVCDRNTVFATFIAAEEAMPDVAPYPEPILAWTAGVYDDALRRCGVDQFRVNANDYCLGELKFGGNAQSISGKRWLHHSSLLWDYDSERMELLKQPKRQPAYRENRPHGNFVKALKGDIGSRSELVAALTAAAAERLELHEVSLQEAEQALSVPHRKVTTLVDPV